jgi:hypothetical protein
MVVARLGFAVRLKFHLSTKTSFFCTSSQWTRHSSGGSGPMFFTYSARISVASFSSLCSNWHAIYSGNIVSR